MEPGPGSDSIRTGEDESDIFVPHTLDVERNDGKLGVFVVDGDIWFLLQLVIEERCLPFRFGCNRVNTNIPPQGI